MTTRTAGIVLLLGVVAWAGMIWLGNRLYSTTPQTAGLDLELLLIAGREVAAGRSPYDPAMLAGAAPVAERLFYSYPPVVAQLLSPVAAIPSEAVFVAWMLAAVAGLGAVTRALAVRLGSSIPPNVAAATVMALAPLMFPFTVGLLFGNLNVFFPCAFGLVLLGLLPRASTASSSGAGIAVAAAAVAKLHPGSIAAWLFARSWSGRPLRVANGAALLTGVGVVGVSLLLGGPQPWLDYAAVVRAGSGADLVDPRNAGPAAQIALLLGGGGAAAESAARTLQIPVAIAALVATAVAAVRLRDPVESLGWAVAASLIILPVTWYHYPSAVIPFAIAAVLRSAGTPAAGRVGRTVLAAAVVAAIAIALLPLIYVAIGLALLAVRQSAQHQDGRG